MSRLVSAVALLLLSAGCAGRVAVPPGASVTVTTDEAPLPGWRTIATTADIARIEGLPERWSMALAAAHAGRRRPQDIEQAGALLVPSAALPRVTPSPGRYWCRTLRLGEPATRARRPAITQFKPMSCFVTVEGRLLAFSKPTGTERPGGYLWEDDAEQDGASGNAVRLVFLGTQARDGRTAAPAYSDRATAPWAGVFERIGDFRWRIVLPAAPPSATLTVIEITPDTPPPVVSPAPTR